MRGLDRVDLGEHAQTVATPGLLPVRAPRRGRVEGVADVPQTEDMLGVHARPVVRHRRLGRHVEIRELDAAVLAVTGADLAEEPVGVLVPPLDTEDVQGDGLGAGALEERHGSAVVGALGVDLG